MLVEVKWLRLFLENLPQINSTFLVLEQHHPLQLNPIVIQVMNEIGIDMTNQQPKLLSDSMIENSFKTVNMGCMDKESCPSLFVKDVLDWNISDPKEKIN